MVCYSTALVTKPAGANSAIEMMQQPKAKVHIRPRAGRALCISSRKQEENASWRKVEVQKTENESEEMTQMAHLANLIVVPRRKRRGGNLNKPQTVLLVELF